MMCNIIVAAIFLLNYGYVESGTNPLTMEGREAINFINDDFMVSIYTGGQHCTGFIISVKLVLTSANCLDSTDIDITKVHVGSPTGGKNKSISEAVKYIDIGFLVINGTITINKESDKLHIEPDIEFEFTVGRTIKALGFGEKGNGSHAQQLQEAELKIVHSTECERVFGVQYASHFCARNQLGKLSKDDGGSPVFHDHNIIGIVSLTESKTGLSVVVKVSLYLNVIDNMIKEIK